MQGTWYMDGQIDDVRIYNRALSAGEILKRATPPPDLEHGLVGHWAMDDGTGSATAADSPATTTPAPSPTWTRIPTRSRATSAARSISTGRMISFRFPA